MTAPRTTLTDGSPVTPDHATVDPATGLQRGYVVLGNRDPAAFAEPVRTSYVHTVCGVTTTMSQPLAETYAAQPEFYTGTYCAGCRAHFPVGKQGEFVWKGTSQRVGTRSRGQGI